MYAPYGGTDTALPLNSKQKLICMDPSIQFRCPSCATENICSVCIMFGETGFVAYGSCLNFFFHVDCQPERYVNECEHCPQMKKKYSSVYHCEAESY